MVSKWISVHTIYASATSAPKGNTINQLKVIFGFSKRRLVAVVIIFAHRNQNEAKPVR
jgi:hypothetical protein